MKNFLSLIILSLGLFIGCGGQGNPQSTTIDSSFFQLDKPTPNSTISSPVNISGQALGTAFFEGTFPISIEDANGQTLGSDQASSTANWMTEKFIPFAAKVSFKTPTTKTGFIVLKNDNPSGLPENSHSAKFPVSFK